MIESDDKEEITMLEITCPEYVMTNEEEEGMESTTPRIEMGSNDASNTS
jgi:hypothetical protein